MIEKNKRIASTIVKLFGLLINNCIRGFIRQTGIVKFTPCFVFYFFERIKNLDRFAFGFKTLTKRHFE